MNPSIFAFLENIAFHHRGGRVEINTSKLAEELGISQQTVSRYLILLEKDGYVVRRRIRTGEEVMLTDKSLDEFKNQYNTLHFILSSSEEVPVEGILFTGLGEGSYYISRKGYVDKIKEFLSFSPFPGTLNLRLTDEFSSFSHIINNLQGFDVEPFEQDGRKFGAIRLLRATMFGDAVGVVLPERTHYERVLEIISPQNLRAKYSLKDGDKIGIVVHKE